jgi:hypothetical protein
MNVQDSREPLTRSLPLATSPSRGEVTFRRDFRHKGMIGPTYLGHDKIADWRGKMHTYPSAPGDG